MSNQITSNQFVPGSISTDKLVSEFINKSFFLSQEILNLANLAGWTVEPIAVCTHSEWMKAVPLFNINADYFKSEPSTTLVDNARWVGVSIRRHEATGKVVVIAKVWNKQAADAVSTEQRKETNVY